LDKRFFRPLPEVDQTQAHEYILNLNNHLHQVRQAAKEVQEREHKKRLQSNNNLNAYQIGDLVFKRIKKMEGKEFKLSPNYLGPYKVTKVNKADITCKHIITGSIFTFHMDQLKMAFVTEDEAREIALVDYNQFVIDKILKWKGDPRIRSTMSFLVKFKDGDEEWLGYTKDLHETIPFEEFVRNNKQLLPLLYTQEVWKKLLKESWSTISGVTLGDCCFIDLTAWGQDYYDRCGLPELSKRYVVKGIFKKWVGKSKKKITIYCPIFKEMFDWDSFSLYAYGSERQLTDGMILVDQELIEKFPNIMKD